MPCVMVLLLLVMVQMPILEHLLLHRPTSTVYQCRVAQTGPETSSHHAYNLDEESSLTIRVLRRPIVVRHTRLGCGSAETTGGRAMRPRTKRPRTTRGLRGVVWVWLWVKTTCIACRKLEKAHHTRRTRMLRTVVVPICAGVYILLVAR